MDAKPLRKVLDLERQKDYNDTAVFGGLDKFLIRWAAQTEGTFNKPSVLKKFKQLQLDKGSYSQLDKEQRKTKIDQILAFVDEYE
ncbi:MAG: DNA helicase RecG, partial [Dehalococcoidales bacterium]|nr:DNA helicase RecG [Dehalococcoidales bacterium]